MGHGPQPPIPNPQSPIPNPQSPFTIKIYKKIKIKFLFLENFNLKPVF
jgi:hypothetical protein